MTKIKFGRSGYPICSESRPNHHAVILSPIAQQELLSPEDDGFPITAFGNDSLGGLLSYLDNQIRQTHIAEVAHGSKARFNPIILRLCAPQRYSFFGFAGKNSSSASSRWAR